MGTFFRLSLSLFLIMITIPAFASRTNMYADIFTGVADTGDAKGQLATGMAFGFDVTPTLHGLTRFQYSFRPATYELAGKRDAFYSHMTATAGLEFAPVLGTLRSMGLSWHASVLAGYGRTSVDVKGIGDENDQGMTFQMYTGLHYIYMQHVAPFIEAGWSHSLYNNTFSGNKIYGFQVLIGCRFSLHPMVRLADDY